MRAHHLVLLDKAIGVSDLYIVLWGCSKTKGAHRLGKNIVHAKALKEERVCCYLELKVDKFDFKMAEVREKNAMASQTLQGLRFGEHIESSTEGL